MSGFTGLIGSETTSLPAELTQVVEQIESLRMVGVVTDWTMLLAAVEDERPDILLLDCAL